MEFALQTMTIIAAGLPWIAAGVLVGVVAGAIPGFGGSNTLAVLLPLTLFLEIHPALLFVVGLFVGIRFGGAVPAILVNVPGTASGSVTALEGYPMRQKGQANFALGVALAASVLGSMVSGLLALIVAPTIATIALKFSAPEIFALSIFSIAMVGQIAGDDLMKGWLAGAASLLVGSVGIDPMWGSERGTMGFVELSDGTPIVPALVGLYGVAEVMALAERTYSASTDRVSYLHQTLILRAREVFRGLLFTLRRPDTSLFDEASSEPASYPSPMLSNDLVLLVDQIGNSLAAAARLSGNEACGRFRGYNDPFPPAL